MDGQNERRQNMKSTHLATQNMVSNVPQLTFLSAFNTVNNQVILSHKSAAVTYIYTVTHESALCNDCEISSYTTAVAK